MRQILGGEIERFVGDYPRSRGCRTSWGRPLVGFASAGDPLFLKLKEAVSPTHAMPGDLLNGAETVIAYFLPFDKSVPRSNRRGLHASGEWAAAYVETNRLIVEVNRHLAEVLKKRGYRVTLLPPTHNFDGERLVSDWSHKHAAYLAGLGRFGTHHLLITERGCCGRLGSVITDAPIEPSERSHTESCLHKYNGTCGICVKKCPVGALNTEAFDRHGCYALLLENADIYQDEGLADVCGKCSSVVPCSFINPVARLLKNAP